MEQLGIACAVTTDLYKRGMTTFNEAHPWAKGGIDTVAFTSDMRMLAYAVWLDAGDNPIKLWDLNRREERAVLHRDSSAIYRLAFSPDGRTLACGNQRGGVVELWDVPGARQMTPLRGHTHNTISVTFSPDNKMLVSGSVDGTIRLWDLASRQELPSFKPSGGVGLLAIAPDGNVLASLGGWARTPQLWVLQTGQERPPLTGEQPIDE